MIEQTKSPIIEILLADDHPIIRRGVRYFLEQEPGWRICAEANTAAEAVQEAERCRPNVAVLDFSIPGLSGLEMIRRVRQVAPQTEVVVYSGSTAEETVHQIFDAGARSFVSKGEGSHLLVEAVRHAALHKPYFTARVTELIHQRLTNRSTSSEAPLPGSILTKRERQTLQYVADGMSNKELAEALGVSQRTAEGHRAALLKKLGVGSTAALVRFAIRNGLVQP